MLRNHEKELSISWDSIIQNEMPRPMSPRELLRRGRPVPTALRSPRKGQRAMRVKPLWFSAYARYARALKALARSFALCETRSKLLVSRVPCRRERRADSLILPGRHLADRHFLFCEIMYFQLKDETDDLSRKRRNTVLNTMSHTC